MPGFDYLILVEWFPQTANNKSLAPTPTIVEKAQQEKYSEPEQPVFLGVRTDDCIRNGNRRAIVARDSKAHA